MNDLDLISEAKIEVTSSGVNETLAKVDQLAGSVESLVVAQDKLTPAQIRVNNALETTAKKYDQEYRAITELQRALNLLERARSQGLSGTEAYARIQDNVTLKLQAQANAARVANEAQQKLAATIRSQAQTSINSVTGVKSDFDTESRAADIAAYGAELDRVREKLVPMFALSQQLARAQEEVADALKVGAISTNEAAAASLRLTRAYEDQTQKLERLAQAQKESAQRSVNSQLIVPDRAGDIEAYGRSLSQLQAKYDPLYRAQQSYIAGLRDLRDTLAVGAISQDVYTKRLEEQKAAFAEQVNALGNYSRAQREAAAAAAESARIQQDAANKARAQGMVNTQTIVPDRGADIAAYAKSLDDLQAKYDPLFAAEREYKAALLEINEAEKVGALTQEQAAKAAAAVTTRFNNQTIEIGKAERAHASLNKGLGLNAYAMQNLSFQVNDVVTSLAAGISPMQTFAQQGGQIVQIFQTSQGGLSGFVSRFVTPMTVGLTALGAAAIYGYTAWSRYDDLTRKVGVTLQGLGRETGLTKGAFEQLAISAAAAGNITVRQATDLGAALAATGRIGPENISKLIGVSKDFAATFSTDLDGIKDKLAAFGTAEGITRLNDQLQFLDARTLRVIQSLFQAGKEQDAIRMAVERLPAALAKSETAQGAVAKAWEAIKNAASDADTAMGRFIDRITKGPSPADRLKELQDRVASLKAADAENLVQPGGTKRTYVPPTSPTVSSTTTVPLPPSRPSELEAAKSELQKYMEKLAETKRAELEMAEHKELEASLNRKSVELKKLTEEAVPGSDTWRKYKDMEIAATDALKSGNPELMKRVDNVKDLSEASSVFEHVVKSMSTAEGERLTAGDRAAEQRRIDIASTRAVSVEERARVAQMQAESRQRGQLITVQQAQADAEHAAQVIREQADQQLRNIIRDQGLEAEEIKKRIALLDQDTESRAVAIARQRAQQDLTRQGFSLNSDLARSVIAGAEANARLGLSYDRALEAQQRMRDGQKELANEFETFVEGFLVGGQKMSEAFSSFAKSLSGNALKAIISGDGPLAGILGTAPKEKGQLGGLLGGNSGLSSLFNFEGISKALGDGAEDGIGKALGDALKPSTPGGGVMSSPLGRGLASAGAGFAIGYSSQSPLIGAVGGGLSGLAAGAALGGSAGPIGAVIGAGAGLLGGLLGESQAKKQAKKQLQQELQARREAYEQAKPQIEALDKTFLGESIGVVGAKITDAETQLKQAAKTASDAGDSAKANQLVQDYLSYMARVTAMFSDSYEGILGDIQKGFGPDGPFASAVNTVQTLGESLKAFVTDAARLPDPANAQRARAAAVQNALGTLDGPKTLSETQTEIERIQGTAAGLNQVLKDLGLTADQAAQAINDGVTKALANLADKFNTDLDRKINEAKGKSYLNDAADLIKEVASLSEDAASLGQNGSKVSDYFSAAAQKIVDDSQLVGDTFNGLVAAFPQLAGVVHEFSADSTKSVQQLADEAKKLADQIEQRARGYEDRYFAAAFPDTTLPQKLEHFDRNAWEEQYAEWQQGGQAINNLLQAQEAERAKLIADYQAAIQERRQSFADRQFAAQVDTTTLAGQLAAFDRKAQQERLEEMKAGGEAIRDLEAAQAAERLKIIQDFQKQAQTAFDNFSNTIKKFLDSLAAGSNSLLSPQDRLAEAQRQYNEQLALARSGNSDAMGSITTYAQQLLDAGKAFYASSQSFQDIFASVKQTLSALPGQIGLNGFMKQYAAGGWVQGPGTGTSDSIIARVSAGEYVMSAEAARRYGPLLEAMNDDRPMATVAAPPRPPTASGNQGNAALLAELRALRARVEALHATAEEGNAINEEGHLQNIAATKDVGAGIAKGNRVASRREVAA
ncbi:phage tail length tape measure family protein [Methylobacterium sp. CM6257]